MKLAMSNIAWHPDEAKTVYGLLKEHGFKGLEFAPGLLFPGELDSFDPPKGVIDSVIGELHNYGLVPVSMQSLHFGIQGAALFGNSDEVAAFVNRIQKAVTLAERMGFSNLVIGSPKNRVVPDNVSREGAYESAKNTFLSLADKAAMTGQTLAIEPNPAAYGTNFLTTIDGVCEFVTSCNHDAITINFDAGALHMNGEAHDVDLLLQRALPKVSHIHISEAWLAPVPSDQKWLSQFASRLMEHEFKGWVSIEMKRPEDNFLKTIETALGAVQSAFST
ncbi:MAG: sugar phosphate isomerase/epimerase [Aquisalinus sp.]|nr:sugar phosphate isomerase/epimerase [Aquisalinus sp.]